MSRMYGKILDEIWGYSVHKRTDGHTHKQAKCYRALPSFIGLINLLKINLT